mgnify:CR=1 FL=1
MRATFLSFLPLAAVIVFIIASCEERDQPPTGATNKFRFKHFSADTASYEGVILNYRLENVKDVDIQRLGVCYDTTTSPTTKDDTVCSDIDTVGYQSIDGLSPDSEYFFRLFAQIEETILYGPQIMVKTLAYGKPTVITKEKLNDTAFTRYFGGQILSDGGERITDKGICWSPSPSPTVNDNAVSLGSGMGSFLYHVSGLAKNQLYYLRAYATSSFGTAYGDELPFTPNAVYEENFSDFDNNNWYIGLDRYGETSIDSGYYIVRSNHNYYKWVWHRIDSLNQDDFFKIKTRVKFNYAHDNDSQAGLIWGGCSEDDFYLFSINQYQDYKYARYENQNWKDQIGFETFPHIHSDGQWNELTIMKYNNRYHFIINNRLADTYEYESFSLDEFGFLLKEDTRAYFDYLFVYNLNPENNKNLPQESYTDNQLLMKNGVIE